MMMHTMCEAVQPVQVVTDLTWFDQAALSYKWRKSQINPSYALQTKLTLFHLPSTHTPSTWSHTHTQPKKTSAFSLLPLCAWQQSLNHTIPKSLTRCTSYTGSTSFLLNSFFCATRALWKARMSFFRLFKLLTLWEESCEREAKQTTSSNKPNLFEVWVATYHLCQCKIFSLTTVQWHVSDVSIPAVYLKIRSVFPHFWRTCC